MRETDGTETKFGTEQEARAFAALCEDAKLPRCGSIQPGTNVACGLSNAPHELHEAGAVTWQNLEYVNEAQPLRCLETCYQDGESEPGFGEMVVTAVWIDHGPGCPNAESTPVQEGAA